MLYLKAQSQIGKRCESLYGIGYHLYGRKAIFYISTLIGIYGWGTNMIYFIVFSDIAKSLIKESVFASKIILCPALGILLIPLILKKELKYLKLPSIILFTGISSFIILLGFQLELNHQDSFI